jgi:small subunit ribosomal protein S4
MSDYGTQLREKQKCKRIFGVLEKQFRRYYKMATSKKGNKGDNLMGILESRLDNVLFLGGFSESRNQARQLIKHGHIAINGKKVTIPSYMVKADMVVTPMQRDKSRNAVTRSLEAMKGEGVPPWLACDPKQAEIRVLKLPSPDEFSFPIQSNLIVELLAK